MSAIHHHLTNTAPMRARRADERRLRLVAQEAFDRAGEAARDDDVDDGIEHALAGLEALQTVQRTKRLELAA